VVYFFFFLISSFTFFSQLGVYFVNCNDVVCFICLIWFDLVLVLFCLLSVCFVCASQLGLLKCLFCFVNYNDVV
jgi:hypothetical protein